MFNIMVFMVSIMELRVISFFVAVKVYARRLVIYSNILTFWLFYIIYIIGKASVKIKLQHCANTERLDLQCFRLVQADDCCTFFQ